MSVLVQFFLFVCLFICLFVNKGLMNLMPRMAM